MRNNRITLQGVVWTFGDRELAALLLDGHTVRDGPEALLLAAQSRGLPLTTDLHHLSSAPVPGWGIDVDVTRYPRTRLTVRWPRPRPLIDAAEVGFPARWQWLAATQRTVLLLVGCTLVTAPDGTARRDALPVRVSRLAESGLLAAGFAEFRSGGRRGAAPVRRIRPRTKRRFSRARRSVA
ncbi:hypothetical protein [Amycolatopsis suaedae]|uniref:hypothetical protein n=1 Tax=Amycolatopsis suaedae TaxID=2510978 RepID=UPI00196B353F|nr:hypothetical protein [Amycolatopsis suaedae]